MPDVSNQLARIRQQRGWSAVELASRVGVSRQTIYAMEAGSYVPNTAVALRLARVLETTVEELFALPDGDAEPEVRIEQPGLLPGSEQMQAGQPVQLCRVDRKLVAAMPSPVQWYFPASDGVVTAPALTGGKTRVHVFDAAAEFRDRVLVAGCDPGISVLAQHAHASGAGTLVLAHRNSSQALALLKEGSVHIAGTHLRDDASGESNLPEIGRLFSKNSVAVISFAVWEEGILTARGNPRNIRGIEDFARPDVSMVNREPGSGSRKLLDSRLPQLGLKPEQVRGYNRSAPGHLPAAWQVRSGEADCCIATRAAARLFGLDFLPLVSERYDLVVRRTHLELPAVQNVLDTLTRSGFRRELESLGGYDVKVAGQRLL